MKTEEQIETAKDIQFLSSLSDKLEAIRVLAKQSKQSLEVQNRIAEYRLRVERKKGEWLQQNIQKGGNRGNQYLAKSTESTLANVGVSKDESSKAQRIAGLGEEQFEQYIEETKATKQELTVNGNPKLSIEDIKRVFEAEEN